MTFEQLYASGWHNPGFFWLGVVVLFGLLARRLPFLYGFVALFGLCIAADALASGALSPVSPSSAAATPIAITFVLLGDFRYFVLVFRYGEGAFGGGAFARALLLTLVVPIASTALRLAVPSLAEPMRVTFLTYELMFFVLALVVRFALLPRMLSNAPPASARFLRELTGFELTQYGLWALADIVILAGVDAGHLLRLAPNALYYAFFLPFVLLRAPRPDAAAA